MAEAGSTRLDRIEGRVDLLLEQQDLLLQQQGVMLRQMRAVFDLLRGEAVAEELQQSFSQLHFETAQSGPGLSGAGQVVDFQSHRLERGQDDDG